MNSTFTGKLLSNSDGLESFIRIIFDFQNEIGSGVNKPILCNISKKGKMHFNSFESGTSIELSLPLTIVHNADCSCRNFCFLPMNQRSSDSGKVRIIRWSAIILTRIIMFVFPNSLTSAAFVAKNHSYNMWVVFSVSKYYFILASASYDSQRSLFGLCSWSSCLATTRPPHQNLAKSLPGL